MSPKIKGLPMSPRVKTALIVLVTVVWAVNFTAPLFIKDYKPPPELHVAFMAVIGLLTATKGPGGSDDERRSGDN